MRIRSEMSGDADAVRSLYRQAFESDAEARLVDALRVDADPCIALVAEDHGRVVGHILFTPVTLDNHAGLVLMGLAPMAVTASRRREGIGSALVRAGLEACRRAGAGAVFVLGHPGYYPRFGFEPAADFGIKSTYDVPDEAFMAVELIGGCLENVRGTVKYHRAFDAL